MQGPVAGADAAARSGRKQALRDEVRAARAARHDGRGSVGEALAATGAARLSALAVVALHVSYGTEPDTGPLRRRLVAAGTRVLLPWLRDDRDLDWVEDVAGGAHGAGAAVTSGPTRQGIGEGTRAAAVRPQGRLLGVDAVLAAGAVVLPALAVDTAGARLGQGGGSYDRVLARIASAPPPRPLLVACVHDDEVLDAATRPLPVEAHDMPVDAVLTPGRWLPVRP